MLLPERNQSLNGVMRSRREGAFKRGREGVEGRLKGSNSKPPPPPRGQECTQPAKSTWGLGAAGGKSGVGSQGLVCFSGRERKKTL